MARVRQANAALIILLITTTVGEASSRGSLPPALSVHDLHLQTPVAHWLIGWDYVVLVVGLTSLVTLLKAAFFRNPGGVPGDVSYIMFPLDIALLSVAIAAAGVGFFDVKAYAGDSFAATCEFGRLLALAVAVVVWLAVFLEAVALRRQQELNGNLLPGWLPGVHLAKAYTLSMLTLVLTAAFYYGCGA